MLWVAQEPLDEHACNRIVEQLAAEDTEDEIAAWVTVGFSVASTRHPTAIGMPGADPIEGCVPAYGTDQVPPVR